MAGRVVLFGGTFDPIHHGHLIVARAVAEHFGLQRVTFVPAAVAPHKAGHGRDDGTDRGPFAPAHDRLEMVRLAIDGEDLFEVSQAELARGGPSYTIETLAEFRRQAGAEAELCCIIGADMLADLPSWRRAAEVVDTARILTATRLPYSARLAETLEQLARQLGPERARRLSEGIVPTATIDISSSEIRRRVAAGRSIRYLTPSAVACYIAQRGLYARPVPQTGPGQINCRLGLDKKTRGE